MMPATCEFCGRTFGKKPQGPGPFRHHVRLCAAASPAARNHYRETGRWPHTRAVVDVHDPRALESISSAAFRERFFPRIQKGPGCWTWTGQTNNKGYGLISVLGWLRPAHRVSWIVAHGSLPRGAHVLHKCDNPLCVRVEHLYLGTHADNMRDKVVRGRASRLIGENHPAAKLTWERVAELRRRFEAGERNKSALAREFGVSTPTARKILQGKLWRTPDERCGARVVGELGRALERRR